MNNPKRSSHWKPLGLAAFVCAGASVMMNGCSKTDDTPVAVVQPPPPPPPPPAPTVTPIADLMAQLNIDARVSLPEEKAPDNDADRKAVLVFFDAFARGNAQAVKTMLPLADQPQLTALVDSGEWKNTTSKISKIGVLTGKNQASLKCALAVIEVGKGSDTSYQPQLWYYTSEGENGSFEAAPTPPGIMDRLTGDWIATWHKILEEEKALAMKPDEAVHIEQRNLESDNDSQNNNGGGGSTPNAPGGLRQPGGTAPIAPGGPPPPGRN